MKRALTIGLFAAAAALSGAAEPAPKLPEPRPADELRAMFESWKAPVPPRKLVGPIHYVGTMGVSSFLITTPQGHILIDTGFADTLPHVLGAIEQLGFNPGDIKLLLSSHAHVDHVGGHAELKRQTGAQVVASAGDRRILESGGRDDYFAALASPDLAAYEPVKVDRVVGDHERITLGGVTLTAHLTPGHTRGATTWTMEAKDGDRTYQVVFLSSVSINPGTRLKQKPSYPEIMRDYDQAFVRLKSLPCDIYFAPHGGQFSMFAKFEKLDQGAGPEALADKEGWRNAIAVAEFAYRQLLRQEEAAIKAAK
ncbi:MAG TPA: subclass B3 metallo-beta-lactamase [Opitutaceae bacterium]|nr:subclass B3 metallo-beta-lactamase [Opitutaceae bacterium]